MKGGSRPILRAIDRTPVEPEPFCLVSTPGHDAIIQVLVCGHPIRIEDWKNLDSVRLAVSGARNQIACAECLSALDAVLAFRERMKTVTPEITVLSAKSSIPTRQAIPEDIRREVFRRDGGRCAICGSNELIQFDHIIPVALGGNSTVDNLQVLCSDCNRKKGVSI
jgi:5-methylcytosine-specific restriction endonuclease McrA